MLEFYEAMFDDLMGVIAFEVVEDDWSVRRVRFNLALQE